MTDFSQERFVDLGQTLFVEWLRTLNNAQNSTEEERRELFKFAAENLAPFIGNVLAGAFSAFGAIVNGVVKVFSNLIGAISGALSKLRDFIDFIKDNPLTKGIGSLFGNSEAPNVPAKTSGSNFSNASFGSTNITINGAIDPVSTARQIYDVLNSQATESGTFNAFGMSYAL